MILSIVLSWNRPHLVRKTVDSLVNHTSTLSKLYVIDNGSEDETKEHLKELSHVHNFHLTLLDRNIGGLAFNRILEQTALDKFEYIHFSENDIEYLPDWDTTLIEKFNNFPEVGQLSPFSPFPQLEVGEFSWKKPVIPLSRNKHTIYLAKQNVGTTSVVRKELLLNGLRWSNIEGDNGIRFPNDGLFSRRVKKMGWKVAYNEKYLVKNWGHNLAELKRDLNYYVANHKIKDLKRFENRLKQFGYSIVENTDGEYILKKNNKKT